MEKNCEFIFEWSGDESLVDMRRPVHFPWPPIQTAQSLDEAGGVTEIDFHS